MIPTPNPSPIKKLATWGPSTKYLIDIPWLLSFRRKFASFAFPIHKQISSSSSGGFNASEPCWDHCSGWLFERRGVTWIRSALDSFFRTFLWNYPGISHQAAVFLPDNDSWCQNAFCIPVVCSLSLNFFWHPVAHWHCKTAACPVVISRHQVFPLLHPTPLLQGGAR